MLEFEILECGLYREKKRYICMSEYGRNVLRTRRYDSVLSPLFFLFFYLIKTAAKFMQTESVNCPARAVFAKSRARHVHIMSLNLLSTDSNYSISRVSYVHSSRTTDESLHYFVLPSLPTSNSS